MNVSPTPLRFSYTVCLSGQQLTLKYAINRTNTSVEGDVKNQLLTIARASS
jgi:hypothetical protein